VHRKMYRLMHRTCLWAENLSNKVRKSRLTNGVWIQYGIYCSDERVNVTVARCSESFVFVRVQNDSSVLMWIDRQRILKDVASGLQYLHTVDKNPLIHGDVKR